MHKINQTGKSAVNHVESFEKANLKISIWSCFDWGEFLHMFLVWLVGALIIVLVLVGITVFDQPSDLPYAVIMRLDTLSLMFSLVFSAALEQIWYNRKGIKYKMTQIAEVLLSFVGLIFYLVYSVMEKISPNNSYYVNRYNFQLIYIIAVVVVVVLGFLARAYKE